MRKRILTAVLAVAISLGSFAGTAFADEMPDPVVAVSEVGKLKAAENTDQLILVEATGLDKVKVSYYKKAAAEKGPGMKKDWDEVFTTAGVYGKNGGTADKKEGDGKTPSVSYTHLDVYKRQVEEELKACGFEICMDAYRVQYIPHNDQLKELSELVKQID